MLKRTLKELALITVIGASSILSARAEVVTGAGATFPNPIYQKWADAYSKKESGFKLNYQSIGSGGGIKQIKEKTVAFGATDKPLKIKDSDESKDTLSKIGLMQFPTVIGGVVLVVNLEGVGAGKLNLTKKNLADIYLGNIKKWNHPDIAKDNKDIKLPDTDISVVHRSDGSGTTFLFADYLSKVSEEWKTKVGADSAVKWPVGIGAKGNEGVASQVKQLPNSIGYVEYSYAKENKLTYTKIETEIGHFIEPTSAAFQNAAKGAKWDEKEGFATSLTNAPGKDSWPITGATFILVYEKTPEARDKEISKVLNFFDWAYSPEADKMAEDLGYIPLPEELTTRIKAYWKDIKDSSGNPVRK